MTSRDFGAELSKILARSRWDRELRAKLSQSPKRVLEQEFGMTLDESHEFYTHEDSDSSTHLILPPISEFTEEERTAALDGSTSLEFLKHTMYDPAPPKRKPNRVGSNLDNFSHSGVSIEMCRNAIERGLKFLQNHIDDRGAWHCVRFNLSNHDVPRHYERPPFISAFCSLALASSQHPIATALCQRTKRYLIDTMEYPGFWRYYRHLPQDLDSTTLCSLVISSHPWILFRKNMPRILSNADSLGRFTTWVFEEEEPGVVAPFRIEADPVVNSNVLAYLGNCPATEAVQAWLSDMIVQDQLEGASKWYPDPVAVYYTLSRAMVRHPSLLEELRDIMRDRLLNLLEQKRNSDEILQTAQTITSLYNLGHLKNVQITLEIERLLDSQQEDGSWPEVLAFGDQSLQWGSIGQIGHGSESVTTAFCIEALERLTL